jgi:hypothetical protein
LITEVRRFSELLKKYDIVIPYEDIVVKDMIHIINSMKKNISFICNLSDLNVTTDLKFKYHNIKKYYNLYEYNALIDVIKLKNYNFNLDNFSNDDFDYLQVIFTDILQEFNYNLNNLYSYNENISKYVLLLKLHNIIHICLEKLDNPEYIYNINENLKNKFYLYQGKVQQNKEDSILFSSRTITNNNKKYLNLFKTIINDIIKNTIDYSSVINKLDPLKFTNNESISYDINDFNDINSTFADNLMGDIEEMD